MNGAKTGNMFEGGEDPEQKKSGCGYGGRLGGEVDRMMAASEQFLNETMVCILGLEVKKVRLDSELADKRRLEVKFRGSTGKTLLKWFSEEVDRPEATPRSGIGSYAVKASFGPGSSVIFEGGTVLTFNLCEPRWARQARLLGSGQIPVALVAEHVRTNCPDGKQLEVKVHGVEKPSKPIASITLHVTVKSVKLLDAGGYSRLKELSVPARPLVDENAFLDVEEVDVCVAYYTRVLTVKQCLLEAYKSLTLGDTRASNSKLRRQGSRVSRGLWRGCSGTDSSAAEVFP